MASPGSSIRGTAADETKTGRGRQTPTPRPQRSSTTIISFGSEADTDSTMQLAQVTATDAYALGPLFNHSYYKTCAGGNG